MLWHRVCGAPTKPTWQYTRPRHMCHMSSHLTGQTRPSRVVRLLAADTIEQRVLAQQVRTGTRLIHSVVSSGMAAGAGEHQQSQHLRQAPDAHRRAVQSHAVRPLRQAMHSYQPPELPGAKHHAHATSTIHATKYMPLQALQGSAVKVRSVCVFTCAPQAAKRASGQATKKAALLDDITDLLALLGGRGPE